MTPRRFAAAAAAGAIAVMTLPGASHAGPWSLAPGETYTELAGEFYSSGSFYNAIRDRAPLPGGGLIERRAMRSSSEFGWTKRTSFQVSLPFVSLTRRDGAGSFSETRTGLGDVGLGLRYGLANGTTASAIQLSYRAPLGYNRKLDPALGDGLQELEAGFQIGFELGGRGFVQFGGGYEYRFLSITGRSDTAKTGAESFWADHATVDAAAAIWLGGGLQVAGLYRSEMPVSQGLGHPETNRQLAGPRITYRVDERLDAFAGSWHSPGGLNSLHVDQFYAGFAWKNTRLGRNQGFLGGARRP